MQQKSELYCTILQTGNVLTIKPLPTGACKMKDSLLSRTLSVETVFTQHHHEILLQKKGEKSIHSLQFSFKIQSFTFLDASRNKN